MIRDSYAYWDGTPFPKKKLLTVAEEDFRDEFQECLENVKVAGSFASSTTSSQYINPGLVIDKVGTIGLPLATRDAKALAAVCKQAPFGRRDETVIDENVRKTWELDSTEFTCSNPAWEKYIDTVAQQAIKNLGVKIPARAEQYKLLLYEEGAFFRAHRDAEKVPGMFGTLVICLPSTHTGGEVLLTHGGKGRKIETAAASSFDLTMLAWYSDVQHEIRPVTSGYRLVITYNLIQDQDLPKQAAGEINADASKLQTQLQRWTNEFPRFTYMMFPLEHKYTQVSLSLSSLKGKDAARCRTLERVCYKNGFWWFLALLTRQKPDEEYDSDYEFANDIKELKFDDTFTPVGERVSLVLDAPVLGQMLTDIDDFYGRDPDSDEEGEWTGNEGMPNKHRYHDTFAVMVKKEHVLDGLSHVDIDSDEIRALFELIRDDDATEAMLCHEAYSKLLTGLMKKIQDPRGPQKFTDYWTTQDTAFDHNVELTSLTAVFQLIADQCHLHGVGKIPTSILREAMKVSQPRPHVISLAAQQIAREVEEGQGQVWDRWFPADIPQPVTYKYANARAKAFGIIESALHASSVPSFQAWKQEILVLFIREVTTFTPNDAQPLRELLDVIPGTNYLDLQVLPTLIPISKLSVADFTTEINQQRSGYGAYMYPDNTPPQYELSSSAGAVIDITQYCVQLALVDEAAQLLREALPDLKSVAPDAWSKWRPLFVFATVLTQSVSNHKSAQLYDITRPFLIHLLRGGAAKLAQSRPPTPRDWHQSNVQRNPCHCDPCHELVKFLQHPHQRFARFSYTQKIREHLRCRLMRNDDFEFITEKTRSPYTLVIQKTNKQFERALQTWKDDVSSMQIHLNDMRNNFTSDLLGGDILEVAGLEQALRTAGAAEGVTLQTASPSGVAEQQNVLQPSIGTQNLSHPMTGAGVKRKIECVDLTED